LKLNFEHAEMSAALHSIVNPNKSSLARISLQQYSSLNLV